jgi:glyoxylase-like metal-dependent hydrolase (beta-lactamase superfamily II)
MKLTVVLGVGTSNNYAYLVRDDKTGDAVIIDPANPPEYVVSSRSVFRPLTCPQGCTCAEEGH